jgi:hypothetical protein
LYSGLSLFIRPVNPVSLNETMSKREDAMTFSNPWIDPRILRVSPAAAREYLSGHGWSPLGPSANPDLIRFAGPSRGEDAPTVLLPTRLDEGSMVQRMIDLVGAVALFEGRWAGEVITDILSQTDGPNGATHPASAGHEAAPV